MYKNLFVVMLSICVILTAQSNNSSKERRVYRTQTGAVIKAPSPLFKKGEQKSKKIYNEKTQAQVQLERANIQLEQLGSQYNARLENLSSQIDENNYIIGIHQKLLFLYYILSLYNPCKAYMYIQLAFLYYLH